MLYEEQFPKCSRYGCPITHQCFLKEQPLGNPVEICHECTEWNFYQCIICKKWKPLDYGFFEANPGYICPECNLPLANTAVVA